MLQRRHQVECVPSRRSVAPGEAWRVVGSMVVLCLVGCGGDDAGSDGAMGTGTETGTLDDSSGSDTEGTASTTGPTTGPTTTVGPDTETEGETETPTDCMSDDECGGDAPFCGDAGVCVGCDAMSDPDGACADASSGDTPVCNAGACVQCTQDKTSACSGGTPVCGDDFGCHPCTEHFECPDSACHLDGSDQGACFDVGDVVEVATGAALQTALNGLSGDDQAVLVLTGGDYSSVQAEVLNNIEVAILGTGSAEISGNTGSGLLSAAGNAIMYVSNVVVRSNGSGDGVTCSGTSVWLDDAQVRNNAQAGLDVSGGCEAHLRRTVVRTNNSGGVRVDNAGVFMVNSAIVENANIGPIPGLDLSDADAQITYSTIVGNLSTTAADSIRCSSASGFVRNSIVSGNTAPSISGCGSLSFENNAVDTGGLGNSNEDVGVYDAMWFVTPAMGNVRLTASGETTFMDIAQWQAGDPLEDVDGNPIPTDVASFPGYHQP